MESREQDDGALGYLFVLTYGRSGSTLLAGLLNAIPGYLIRGENGDALRHLYDFHTTLMTERTNRPNARKRTHPWFGISDVPEQKLLDGARRLALDTVLRPKTHTRVTGFKEIRWWKPGLEEYVAWMRAVFPGARFVVNTRAHDAVLQSAWYRGQDPDVAARGLAATEEQILATAAGLGEAAFRVHYDDYVADPTRLRALYDWLGEPWDEDAGRATLAVRHSVQPR